MKVQDVLQVPIATILIYMLHLIACCQGKLSIRQCVSYRSQVRLAAVISRGNVSHVEDAVTTAHLWIQTIAVIVSDAAEDFLNGGWVVADDVGSLGNVIAVSGGQEAEAT